MDNVKLIELEEELEYLRYCYGELGFYLGPSEEDIYQTVDRNYKIDTGKELPKGY